MHQHFNQCSGFAHTQAKDFFYFFSPLTPSKISVSCRRLLQKCCFLLPHSRAHGKAPLGPATPRCPMGLQVTRLRQDHVAVVNSVKHHRLRKSLTRKTPNHKSLLSWLQSAVKFLGIHKYRSCVGEGQVMSLVSFVRAIPPLWWNFKFNSEPIRIKSLFQIQSLSLDPKRKVCHAHLYLKTVNERDMEQVI